MKAARYAPNDRVMANGECHDGQGGAWDFCRGHDRAGDLRLHLHAEANEKASE